MVYEQSKMVKVKKIHNVHTHNIVGKQFIKDVAST